MLAPVPPNPGIEPRVNDAHPETDPIRPVVSQFFDIDQVVWARPGQPFVVRYRGRLLGEDSAEAYERMAEALRAQKLIPMFAEEGHEHIVQIVDQVKKPKAPNPWINLALFLLTLFSMVFAGILYGYEGPEPSGAAGWIQLVVDNLADGMPFALSLLGILLAHELGHYVAGRYHKTEVTLPFFLPFPFSPFGTLGAFIQLREPPRNKRILLDIGLAGPIAGLLVAIPVLLVGLSLSDLNQLPDFVPPGEAFSLEGNSILYLLAKYVTHGELLPAPVDYGGMSQLVYWVRYVFTGLPTPLGGTDVFLHPMAWAGWAGLLVTALNLIPAGQLDGGHTLYALFGNRARLVLPFILLALGAMGFFWSGWWLWVFLILMMGSSHAQPLDQITGLDLKRKWVAVVGLIMFVLLFTPVPLRLVAGPYFGP